MKLPGVPARTELTPAGRAWLVAVIVAGVLAVGVYGQWLSYRSVPISPADDLAKHVAVALNFFGAAQDGQWLPRLQLNPADMPDIPTFQYYGFMSGVAAYPYVAAGLTGIQAVAAALVTMHFLGFLALYAATRTLGLKSAAGLLVLVLYALEPYLISTVYGRVAVPESHAQCLLLFGLWASALLWQGRWRGGFVVTALTVMALALTHNIFLLYGSVFFAILAVLGAANWRGRWVAAAAFATGVLLSGFQWLPILQSVQDLDVNFLKNNPYKARMFTEWGGLVGILRPLPPTTNCFFTYSWWTLPALFVLAALGIRERKTRALAVAGIGFFIVSLGLVDVWDLLPKSTWALQFPYRLISFVSLAACLGAGFAAHRWLNPVGIFLVGLLAALSGLTVLYAPAPEKFMPLRDAQIASDFALRDYASTGSNMNVATKIAASDGWLIAGHKIRTNGRLPAKVELLATSVFSDRPIEIWLERAAQPGTPISHQVVVAPGIWQPLKLEAESSAREIRIVASEYLVPAEFDHNPQGDKRRLSLRLSFIAVDGNPVFNTAANARLLSHSGYTRTFALQAAAPGTNPPPVSLVTLPTAYSRFLKVTQDGKPLEVQPAPNALAAVHPISASPLQSSYHLPIAAVFVTFLGVGLLLGGIFLLKDDPQASQLPQDN